MEENNYICRTPIVYIFFNRLNEMKASLEAIKKVKPHRIYLVSDGARSGHERTVVDNCRQYVESFIDWNCEIIKDYAENNMGCKNRVYSGISNAFLHENKVIIIEDDIVPNVSFFKFMDLNLDKYVDNENVMMVSGYNVLGKFENYEYDYCFSSYPSIWGWGTWKRAWNNIDIEMTQWNINNRKVLRRELPIKVYLSCKDDYNDVAFNGFDTWDFQWRFTRQINHGLGVVPSKNMIVNIGFNDAATHTKSNTNKEFSIYEIECPYVEPVDIGVNGSIERKLEYYNYGRRFWLRYIKKILKNWYKLCIK